MALNVLFRAFLNYQLMTKEIYFKLFESKVQSILLYASEIWGLFQLDSLEVVHMQACKQFLGVPTLTPNKMVYGDLHRFPLHVISSLRAYKYWIRVLNMDNDRLPKLAYNMLLSLDNNGKSCWVTQVKLFLCNLGFQYVWLDQNVQTATRALPAIKQRLVDNFIQNWNCSIFASNRYSLYRSINDSFFERTVIFTIDIYCYRKALSQLRFGVLPIHGNRYRFSLHDHDKLCPLCIDCVEDEIHFIQMCPLYSDLRNKIYPTIPHVPIQVLLKSQNVRRMKELAKFTFLALKIRRKFIDSQANANNDSLM
jgi:hypothetical protein